MKHIKNFESYINESEVNEMLRLDTIKIGLFLRKLRTKIKDSSILNAIESFIAIKVIDPYTNYTDLIKTIEKEYNNEPIVMNIVHDMEKND
jgi:hypothetical protein